MSSLASSPEEPVTSAVQSPVSVARTSFPGMAAPSEGRLRLPPHPTSQTLLSKVSADLSQFSAAHMYLMAHSCGGEGRGGSGSDGSNMVSAGISVPRELNLIVKNRR